MAQASNPKHFSLRHVTQYSRLLARALGTPLLVYFILAGNIVTFGAAWLFTLVEEGVNPQLHSYFDALWWAFCTVSTVGYGDVTPVTTLGRLIAMTLMVTGIAFFVGFAAVLVSAIDTLAASESADRSTALIIEQVHEEVKLLRAEVRELRRAQTKM